MPLGKPQRASSRRPTNPLPLRDSESVARRTAFPGLPERPGRRGTVRQFQRQDPRTHRDYAPWREGARPENRRLRQRPARQPASLRTGLGPKPGSPERSPEALPAGWRDLPAVRRGSSAPDRGGVSLPRAVVRSFPATAARPRRRSPAGWCAPHHARTPGAVPARARHRPTAPSAPPGPDGNPGGGLLRGGPDTPPAGE
jgi:hypothetical protein